MSVKNGWFVIGSEESYDIVFPPNIYKLRIDTSLYSDRYEDSTGVIWCISEIIKQIPLHITYISIDISLLQRYLIYFNNNNNNNLASLVFHVLYQTQELFSGIQLYYLCDIITNTHYDLSTEQDDRCAINKHNLTKRQIGLTDSLL